MFARLKAFRQNGTTYQYLQILESYRDEQGRPRQRVVANLGRYDPDDDAVDRLVRSLARFAKERFFTEGEVGCEDILRWGPVLLARHLWDQIGLGDIVRANCRSAQRRLDIAELSFVLVANRLCEPKSEHGLARWLEHTFVCDQQGRRWIPKWLPSDQITKTQRVKVQPKQLNRWYRTLDALVAGKDQIEKALYERVRDLFNLEVELVFYDLTTTYFSYRSPKGQLRRHGSQCKDGKPRNVHLLLGVVMANGFPIAHHIFAGNTAEKTTVEATVRDLERRFGIRHVIVVADRGLMSQDNLKVLTNSTCSYLLGLKGRRCKQAAQVLDAIQDDRWEQIDQGNRVQEVRLPNDDARYFVVDSHERKLYEQSLREKSMEQAREALEKVASAVKKGQIKQPSVIGARAARAAGRHHCDRYYSWSVPGTARFEFHEDSRKMAAELRREGKYILTTDDPRLSAPEVVTAYKQLNTVERGFRDLKDILDMRPIFHKTDSRIKAHVFVASLALFLKRTLDCQLAATWPEMSSTDAIAAMRSVGLAELTLAGKPVRLVGGAGRDARRLVKTLGIRTTNPPMERPMSQM